MEEGATVGNLGKACGDPEVLNSLGSGHLLALCWTRSGWKSDSEGRDFYYEYTIDPNKCHIIGCDEDQTRQLLLYKSKFVDSTIRSYLSDTPKGVIDRVCRNNDPEMSPNILHYSEDEYPHRDFALSCGIRSSFCFPYVEFDELKNDEVMEIVSTCNQYVATLMKFCRSLQGFDWPFIIPDKTYRRVEHYAIKEIDHFLEIGHFLEVVCQTFQLPLTQCWCILDISALDLKAFPVHQFSHGDFENLAPWCHFKDACFHTCVDFENAPLGRSSENSAAFFCRNMTELSITHYPFAHYAQNCGSISCFTIFLGSDLPGKQWALEFFLPPQEMDNYYPQTLLNSIWAKMKECLPNYKLASGEQLGRVLSVKVINSSARNEPKFFKLGQQNPPIRLSRMEEGACGFTTDELVEVSCDEDLEYAKTTASKRLEISNTSFTLENIRKHFGRPQKDAAESFGVSLSTFKRNCRLVGITRWQPGKRKLIDNETGQRNFSSGMPHVQDVQDTPAVAPTCQELNNMDVKVMYNGVPIRFEIPTSSGITELENNVIERLPLNKKSFSIKYQDDEGDWVLIACDKDVQKCFEISRSLKKATIKMLLDPPVT